MNHCCHGDRFTIGGKSLYRCFLDGAILVGTPDDRCSNCGREVVVAETLGEVPTRVQTQYRHPTFGWLPYDPEADPELSQPSGKEQGAIAE